MEEERQSGFGNQFHVVRNGLTFACRLSRSPGTERLVVMLKAHCERPKERPPVFLFWPNRFAEFAHNLRVSDPSLFFSEGIRYGAFLGREHQDPLEGTVAIAAETAAKLGIPPEHVMFFGISGGGFAALMCATRMRGAAGLALNPQVEPKTFVAAGFAKSASEVFRDGSDLEWIAEHYPLRLSLTAALRAARAEGYVPRLTVLQNVTDVRHLKEHFRLFCDDAGLGPLGGTDATGRLRAFTYDAPGGHSTMPDQELLLALARDVLGLPRA